jgi:hypothetical protein
LKRVRLRPRPGPVSFGAAVLVAIVAFPLISAALPAGSSSAVACTEPTPTPTPTAPEPSPSPTRNPDPTTPPPVERVVTLTASKSIVKYGGSFLLEGELSSIDGMCREGEKIQIMSQTLGSEIERPGGSATTDSDGTFIVSAKSSASAMYWAVARESRDENGGIALEAVSEPVTVLGKVEMVAKARNTSPERGKKFEITAQVKPEHPGSFAWLERKKDNGNWGKVKKDKANASGFTFKIKANWKGKRVFRVTWIKSDEDHEPDSSNKVKIKPVKPVDRDDRGGGGRGRG